MIAPATRLIRSHEPWEPHGYQTRAVAHLTGNGAAALFLDPGLGKTSIVLEAFRDLKAAGLVKRMLVVAPLRVCQLVWKQEGRKWSQFRDLTFSLLHGPKKDERLREQTDIHLINPEGIAWFTQQFFGRTDLPYEIVTIDELTKFKNARAARSKKLRAKLPQVKYVWGLTGSPASNGYMDLFGQMLILDGGASLGRFISYFRDQYFIKDFDGFTYKLKPDGAARIEARIAPYVLRMSADDYGDLPEQIDNEIKVELSKEARAQYDEMKKEMIISLPEGIVTAANSAAVYTKLSQLANGAVYLSSDSYAVVHDAKLDALEELVEELAGQQLLVAYEFQHDLARLQERFPNAPTLTGLSHKRIVELEAAWNNGEVPIMFAHPASAGHGLNLQGSGAAHVCWFSKPWDLDLYDQFIRRLRRQGTTAKLIMNHALVVTDSIDQIKDQRLKAKDVTQTGLLNALNAEIIKDGPAPIAKGDDMVLRKLVFQQGQQQEGGAAAPAAAVKPKGWGTSAGEAKGAETAPIGNDNSAPQTEEPKRPKGWGAPAGTAVDPQREEINSKLRAPEPTGGEEGEQEEPPASVKALAAFGGLVQPLTGEATEPPPEGAERAETTAAGVSESGSQTPRGWGGQGAVSGQPEPMQDVKPQDTEKKPTRARRTAVAPAAGVETRPEIGSNTGAAGSALNGFEVYGQPSFITIKLEGLPAEAAAAGLEAIARAMRAQ